MGPSGRSRVVNERSTSLVVVGGSTGGLRGTLFHRGSFYFILFYFFLSFFFSHNGKVQYGVNYSLEEHGWRESHVSKNVCFNVDFERKSTRKRAM